MGDTKLVDSVNDIIKNKHLKVDSGLLTMLVHAYSKCDPTGALALWETQETRNCARGDLNVYSALLAACGNASNLRVGTEVC